MGCRRLGSSDRGKGGRERGGPTKFPRLCAGGTERDIERARAERDEIRTVNQEEKRPRSDF